MNGPECSCGSDCYCYGKRHVDHYEGLRVVAMDPATRWAEMTWDDDLHRERCGGLGAPIGGRWKTQVH